MTKSLYAFGILVLFSLYSWGQTTFKTLNITLEKASEKYGIEFTFDDHFIRSHLSLNNELPPDKETFFELLDTQFEIITSPISSKTYVLKPYTKNSSNSRICGSVYSQLEHLPVSDLQVIMGNQIVLTNESGYFEFYPKKKQNKELVFVAENGKRKTEPLISPSNCEFYFLDEGEIQLGEVIINYTAPLVKKNSKGSYELNPNSLLGAAGLVDPDIFFLVQRLPGVNSPTADASLFIRGGAPDQNLVLWNGTRLFHTNHAYGGLMSINPYGIDHAELITKGVTARLGEHTSGVLLLENTAKWKSKSHLSLGSNTIDSDMEGDLRINSNSRIQFAYRSSFNSTLSNDFYNHSFNRLFANNFDNTPNNQTLDYRDIELVYHQNLGGFWNLKQSAFLSEDRSSYELISSTIDLRDQLDNKNYGGSLQLTKTLDHSRFIINGQFSKYDANFQRDEIEYELSSEDDEPEENDEPEIEFLERNKRENEVLDYQVSVNHTLSKEEYSFRYGGDFTYRTTLLNNYNSLNEELVNDVNRKSSTTLLSGFTEYSKNGVKYSFDIGTRILWFTALNQFRIEPRLNGSYKISEGNKLNAVYERKSQSIYKVTETLTNSVDRYNNLWVTADQEQYPLLLSEQIGFGFTHNQSGLTIDVDLYSRKMRGLTTFNYGYLDPNDQDFHTGSAEILGLDLFLQKKYKRSLLWMSYSFQDNLNQFQGLNANKAFPSNFQIKHYLNTSARIDLNNISLEINSLYRSGIPYSEPTGYEMIGSIAALTYDKLNERNAPDYWRFDFSLNKSVIFKKNQRLSIKVALLNLLQRDNIVERFYRINNQTKQIERLDRYDLQPRLKVGLRFSL